MACSDCGTGITLFFYRGPLTDGRPPDPAYAIGSEGVPEPAAGSPWRPANDPPSGSDPLWFVVLTWTCDAVLMGRPEPFGAVPGHGEDGASVQAQYSDDNHTWHYPAEATDLYIRVRVGTDDWSPGFRIAAGTHSGARIWSGGGDPEADNPAHAQDNDWYVRTDSSLFLDTLWQRVGGAWLRKAAARFTAALKAKLDGVEDGAQVNPLHFIRFSAQDAGTVPSTHLIDGEIGIYAADGSTQLQGHGVDVAGAGILYLPKRAASFSNDPTHPGTDLTAYDLTRMLAWIVDNPGSSVIVSLTERGSSDTVFFQADLVEAYGTQGYRLSALTHLRGHHDPASYGTGWNVTVTATFAVGSKDIIDLVDTLDAYVRKTDLEGAEDSEFASYDNSLFGGAYWPGNFCFFSQATQPTDDTNAIGWPYLTSGSGTLAWGDLRADSNPDASWTPEDLDASEWPSGRVVHISPWHPYLDNGHVRVTLTSAATKVGTGNGAHLWATASWVVVGSLAGDTNSDYFRWSEIAPTTLKGNIPPDWIANPPWVREDGSNVTDLLKEAIQGANEDVTLSHTFRVNATNVDYYVVLTEPGGDQLNTLQIRVPATDTQSRADVERLLKPAAWVEVGDYTLDITSNATVATIGNSTTFTANYIPLSGTRSSDSALYKVRVVGEDVHRGQLARQAFVSEDPNTAGKGGSQHQAWTRGLSDADADWILYAYHVGNAAPANPFHGMLWSDTGTDDALKRYDGSAWQDA